MGRAPCCQKVGLNRGAWTTEEDLRLVEHILLFGHSNWRQLPKQAGLLRCGKSCRLRWINYLRPDIKRGNFTVEEEETIIKLHGEMGNKWSQIAACLPGRTDNEIKNVWNTNLKKKLSSPSPTNNHIEPTSSSSISSSSSVSDLQHEAVKEANEAPDHAKETTDVLAEIEVEGLNMDPMELWGLLEDPVPTLQHERYHSCTSNSNMGSIVAGIPDILIEPEIMEGISHVMTSDDTHQTSLEVERQPNWLVELEQELDLWGTTTATTIDDGQQQQQGVPWLDGDDLVCSYFQKLPTSPSIFDLIA